MRKFIVQVLIVCFLTAVVFAAVKLGTIKNHKRDYTSAFVDKLQILKAHQAERKIVILGGSGVGWGLSAALIEQETGIKTINLGHHAGLGLIDYQDFVLRMLGPDDLILFSPEWNFYYNPYFYDEATLNHVIRYDPAYGLMLRKPGHVAKFIFSEIRFKAPEPEDESGPYRYRSINANGDVVSHCNLGPDPAGPERYDLDQRPFDIGQFYEAFPFVSRHKTVILFPPTQAMVYEKNRAQLQGLEAALGSQHLKILNSAAENVYPDSCFFNASYHLRCEDTRLRTQKLLGALKEYL